MFISVIKIKSTSHGRIIKCHGTENFACVCNPAPSDTFYIVGDSYGADTYSRHSRRIHRSLVMFGLAGEEHWIQAVRTYLAL